MATFGIVNVAKQMLAELNCPASTLASLANISGARLSQYLKEVLPCGGGDELKLRNSIASLRKLVEYSRPLPLNLSEVGDIRRCIELLESNRLSIVIFENEPVGEQQ